MSRMVDLAQTKTTTSNAGRVQFQLIQDCLFLVGKDGGAVLPMSEIMHGCTVLIGGNRIVILGQS